ncbi:MAG: nucleotidyltransferase family protein [Thermomicrobiales bacterium]
MVIPLITANRAAITAVCQRYGVVRLELFGSAAKGAFDDATSDLDFVIAFADYGTGVSSRFIDFADALEALFGRSVDLVFDSKMKNPYFRASVNQFRQAVFDTPCSTQIQTTMNRRSTQTMIAQKSPSPAHRERG